MQKTDGLCLLNKLPQLELGGAKIFAVYISGRKFLWRNESLSASATATAAPDN